MLSKNIDRLRAESDMRQADLMIRSQTGEGIKSLLADLRKQMGEIMQYADAYHALKYDRATESGSGAAILAAARRDPDARQKLLKGR